MEAFSLSKGSAISSGLPHVCLNQFLRPEDGVDYDDDDVVGDEQDDDDKKLLNFAIDLFLRGDYDHKFSDDSPAPHPGLTPQKTVEAALFALRDLDDPEPSHGAAVLMRFCVPLSRGERWGDSSSNRISRNGTRPPSASWKEVLRGAITATMLARRLRASEFLCLLGRPVLSWLACKSRKNVQ